MYREKRGQEGLRFFSVEKIMKPFAKSFYKSKAWKQCRESYISERIGIDGGLCEVCKKRLGYIVHHKITLTESNINNPVISLNHEHLSYECKSCHDEHEGHGVKNKSQGLLVVFDENGQPVPLPPKTES